MTDGIDAGHPDTLTALTPAQLSPLSIQAAALVRSIEGLSNIFWISIGGIFLTMFFAGLSQLEVNATTDYIYLGEYQVPRSILPLASLAFAMFTFWMTDRLSTQQPVPHTGRTRACAWRGYR